MYPFNNPLEAITEADLQALVGNVEESKALDYKATLPGGTAEQHMEFLTDVAAFANAGGGHLVYGVRETEGMAQEIVGLSGTDPDKEQLRLLQKARDGIAPPIPGFAVRAVPLESGSFVLIVRVPRSWRAPHAVVGGLGKGTFRFFSRTGAGKHPLEIGELRSQFMLSESIGERARSFRAERLARIAAEETPLPLVSEVPRVVLHTVPLQAFEVGATIAATDLERLTRGILNLSGGTNGSCHNVDGYVRRLLVNQVGEPERIGGYVQIFRTGAVEAVDTYYSVLKGRDDDTNACGYLVVIPLEVDLVEAVAAHFEFFAAAGIAPPAVITLSLIGFRGYALAVRDFMRGRIRPTIDRDHVVFPEILADPLPSDLQAVAALLRPLLDAIWNAGGFPQSPSFKDGAWKPDR